MSGRVVNLHASIHHTTQELLPWFVMDTLEGEELALVRQHLNVCSQCQEDVEWQHRTLATAPQADAGLDADAAFQRLLPRLGEQEKPAGERPSLLRRFTGSGAPWMRWALAAQLAVIAGLGAMLTLQEAEPSYRLMSAAPGMAANAVVMFRPETSEQDLRRVLKDSGARIVGGPTAADAWLLAVPEGSLAETVRRLRDVEIVTMAESLHEEGRPK